MKLSLTCVTFLSILLATSGCNQLDYELAPVSGTVTLDGEPLAGGVVNFQPRSGGQEENPGPGSTARCDSQGRYELETIHGDAGAVVGNHRVRIYSYSAEADTVKDDTDSGANREKVPEKYNYKSRLAFDVTIEGTESADFTLVTE